jgi:ATP-dependent DNA ligase
MFARDAKVRAPLHRGRQLQCRRRLRIRYRHHDTSVFLYAFDLIELDGDDLRRDPLAVRKALARLLARVAPGLRFNEHIDDKDGPMVFAQACKLIPAGRA